MKIEANPKTLTELLAVVDKTETPYELAFCCYLMKVQCWNFSVAQSQRIAEAVSAHSFFLSAVQILNKKI